MHASRIHDLALKYSNFCWLFALALSACRTTEVGVVEEPKQPEPYLAKIVDYGAFSHDGYFLQKNAILKYRFGNASGDRGTKVDKRRLSIEQVNAVIDRLNELGVSDWLPNYGSARSDPAAQGWSACGFSSWEFHLRETEKNPEVRSSGTSMFPSDENPKKASVMSGSKRSAAVWDTFRNAFEGTGP